VEETAEAVGILPATVKTRYLRVRRLLQEVLAPEGKTALESTFPFAGPDCARMTERVLEAL
jgi:RNA polymerase sigma-70 factor (ECF subfamily)